MWWRCSECNRFLGKRRTRCIVCGAMLCYWCASCGFCSRHFNQMNATGKKKAYAAQAGYITVAVLLVVFFMISVISLANSGIVSEQLIYGSTIGLFVITIICFVVYRAILRSIHRNHHSIP